MGGALFLPAAESVFANRLLRVARITVPSVPAAAILATGASELGHTFSAVDIPGILIAYMSGLKWTFAVAVAANGLTFPLSLAAKPQSIKPDRLAAV